MAIASAPGSVTEPNPSTGGINCHCHRVIPSGKLLIDIEIYTDTNQIRIILYEF